MSDAKGEKVTAMQRARMLVGKNGLLWDQTVLDGIKIVAKSIEDAENAAYDKGFAEAREAAAKIVLDHYWDSLQYKGIGEKHGKSMAEMIEALRPAINKPPQEGKTK